MVDVRNFADKFEAANVQVALCGMGTVERLASFRRQFRLTFPCLSDPDAQLYQALQVPRGRLAQVAGVGVWLPALKALLRAGFGMPRGDVLRMQATFVIDTQGTIRFSHSGKNSADNPSNDELLKVVQQIVTK